VDEDELVIEQVGELVEVALVFQRNFSRDRS
jgi:hypothetical protein